MLCGWLGMRMVSVGPGVRIDLPATQLTRIAPTERNRDSYLICNSNGAGFVKIGEVTFCILKIIRCSGSYSPGGGGLGNVAPRACVRLLLLFCTLLLC